MTDRRKAMIAKIKIAQQQLQMADDSYRAMLARLADGKTSSTKLTLQQLDDVLAEMKRLGFVQKPAQKHGRRPQPKDTRETLMARLRHSWPPLAGRGNTPRAWQSACIGSKKWNGWTTSS
jgi:phage gp16-like protein